MPVPAAHRKISLGGLKPIHRAIAREAVKGRTASELADLFGFTTGWMTQIMNSPMFQRELARLEKQAEQLAIADHLTYEEELYGLGERAIETIAMDLAVPTPSAKKTDVAFKVLDRIGLHPRQDNKGNDNRRYTFINLAPQPGEDPAEAQKRISGFVERMKPAIDVEPGGEELSDEDY